MTDFFNSMFLMLSLLNPFLLIIYLVEIIEKLAPRQFRRVLLRAGLIAAVVFVSFAMLGDFIFTTVLQANFASFQIFGGVIFLIIGTQFVFQGPRAISLLRGESKHLSGAVAMPVMIGPGTVSASVLIGKRSDWLWSSLSIMAAMVVCILTIFALKTIHDCVRPKKEELIDRYIEIMGRISALYVGTIAVEMIMTGLNSWLK